MGSNFVVQYFHFRANILQKKYELSAEGYIIFSYDT